MNGNLSVDAIRQQVFSIIAKQVKADVADIRDESTLKDLGVSSLDAIEVIFDIEDQFGIAFPEQQGGPSFDNDTVGQLVDSVITAKSASPKGEGAQQ